MTDELHGWLSGPAIKKILERAYRVYGDDQFQNLSEISVSQIYNLRRRWHYRGKRFTHTRPVAARIGERARPEPQGKPGYIRIDTVHQGDYEGQKGVNHINAVDEVTQGKSWPQCRESTSMIWPRYWKYAKSISLSGQRMLLR